MLRAAEPTDLDMLYRWESDPAARRIGWGEAPVSRHLLWQYLQDYTADIYRDRQLRLVIDIDGTAVGTIDITDFDPANARAMVGVYVDSSRRRQGIAKAALDEAVDYCRHVLCLHQLTALVARDNAASMALFTSAGFRTAGCLRSWLRTGPNTFADAIIFQKFLQSATH